MTTKVAVKRLHPEAILPKQGKPGDAGYDLHAMTGKQLNPGQRETFATGIAVAIPDGYAGIIKPRSGLANRHGLNVLAGVIDSSYRGDIGVVIHNTDPEEPYAIQPWERIAQLLVVPVAAVEFETVLDLPSTERGEGGFGSTGTH
jgi:dUTP pyrophosphatase